MNKSLKYKPKLLLVLPIIRATIKCLKSVKVQIFFISNTVFTRRSAYPWKSTSLEWAPDYSLRRGVRLVFKRRVHLGITEKKFCNTANLACSAISFCKYWCFTTRVLKKPDTLFFCYYYCFIFLSKRQVESILMSF